jgi:uncharacterized protein
MPTTNTRTKPRGGTSRATAAHTKQPPRAGTRAQPSTPGRVGPVNEWLELRRSPIHGLGGFARGDIPKGTRIIEYTGEKISNAEADRRYDDDTMKRHHTFLFVLNSRTCVDAAFEGNEARFLNHSCAPNCEAVIERGHIWIDALTDIPAGAELLYDYQYEDDPEYTQDDLRFYACHCGAPNCRGTIVKTRRRVRPAATP